MEIQAEFKELLELFTEHKVDFIIVGGYALAFHGHPRMTGDIDLLVAVEAENSKKILAALKDFGFGSLGLKESDFTEPGQVVQLGYPPKRIDIMTSIDGVPWEQIKKNAVHSYLDNLSVDFISLDDFLQNKHATGRPKDLADAEALESQNNSR